MRPRVPIAGAVICGVCCTMVTTGHGWGAPVALSRTQAAIERPSAGSARLRGVVVAAADGRPLRRAEVRLTGNAADSTAITDDQGAFSFDGLPAGRYVVTASKPGYLAVAHGASRPGVDGTPIVVPAGGAVTGVRVALPRGGVITGTVIEPGGTSARGVAVSVCTTAGTAETRVQTDARGVYRAFGLPAGEYLVVATPGPGIRALVAGGGATALSVAEVDRALAELKDGSKGGAATLQTPAPTGRYASVFHPGTTDWARATPVRLAAGEERRGVDVALVLARTVRLGGTLVGPDGGAPLPAVQQVTATPLPPPPSTFGLPALVGRVDSRGRFLLENIVPGRYVVTATAFGRDPTGRTSTLTLWAATEVDVPDADVTDVDLALRPGLRFTGRVEFDAGALEAPANPAAIRIRLEVERTAGFRLPAPGAARLQPDGGFAIEGLVPGTYRLAATVESAVPLGWWLRSAVAGGRDLLDGPLVFDDRAGVTGAVLTFSDRPARLTGTLHGPPALAMSAYSVLLFPADRALWRPGSRRLRLARPDTVGQFRFASVVPGEYLLAAYPGELDAETWQTPAFLERISGAGTRVRVEEGEHVTQDLQGRSDGKRDRDAALARADLARAGISTRARRPERR